MLCLKTAGCMAHSVDPDETPHSVTSHLGLHCLLRPVCLNTYDKYGNLIFEQAILLLADVSYNCWMHGKQCRPDQMLHSLASDLGLHCCSVLSDPILMICKYGNSILPQF